MATATARKSSTDESTRGSILDVLRELLAGHQEEEVVALVTKLVSRNRELELLLAKLRLGKNKSERLSPGQLDLFLDQLRAEAGATLDQANEDLLACAKANGGRPDPVKPPRQPAVRKPPPPGLRRVDNPIPVPEGERPCPVCGAERACVAHEVTEVIDLIPAEVIVRRDAREVLACKACDGEMIRAPMGDKVVKGGAYGSALVADLVVGKYRDGLPLNRQREILEGLGLSMSSSTISDQIMWAAELLQSIWRQLMAEVLRAEVLHVDGTGLPVLDRDGPKGIVTGSLWGYVGDKSKALYLATSTGKRHAQRAGEIGPVDFLTLRQGPIVADAAGLFDTLFLSEDRIEVGCNMHARRYFVKALDAGDARAAVPLTAFRTLYDVEAELQGSGPAERRASRQRRSKPVYDELIKWCRTHQPLEPPSSLLGKAIQYTLNHQIALMRFLDDGVLPIDNGIVERLHRRPAIGRRNFLFAGSYAGAERAAIVYSVLGTCALLGLDPVRYLAGILPRLARGISIARDLPALMPAAWQLAHPE